MAVEQLNCPKCGQVDMVQKVSAIYSGGITTSSLSGSSVGGAVPIGKGQVSVGGGYTTLEGGSQSLLSSRLAPPSQPSAEGISCAAVGVAVVLLCIGIPIFIVCIGNEEALGPATFGLILSIIGIVIWGGSYCVATERKRESELEMPKWEKTMARWDKLYFCARDDGVFDPNERLFIPTREITDYLYR